MFEFLQIPIKGELEDIIKSLESNKSNNYKDNAQEDYKKLQKHYATLKEQGKLNSKQIMHYEKVIEQYGEFMKGYTHKDQTPYW